MPARYEQLDWLEADGAQWVLTGYVPKCTDRFEISLLLKNPSATQCMYCSRGSTSSALTMSGFVLNGKTMRFDRYSNGDNWKDSGLMLYTIIELISSSVHNIIINGTPCDLATYKPYLFDSIRAIVAAFRA